MSLKTSLFEKHYQYYKKVGVETIKQQAGQVEQVSSDYQGRVIYEMLQNAFDKADRHILVRISDTALYIANDGTPFNYTANYDYDRGTNKRGDFQALCSMSTSTKSVAQSIGNKGVGFKSSFSVARDGYVNIYTKGLIVDGGQETAHDIHFRIHNEFKSEDRLPTDLPDALRAVLSETLCYVQKEGTDRGIPGYYFPIPLDTPSQAASELLGQGYVTIIEIPFQDRGYIEALIDEIREVHFQFIQIKYPRFSGRLTLNFEKPSSSFSRKITNSRNFYSIKVDSMEIRSLAERAKIAIKTVEIGMSLRSAPGGLLYNYLPTQVTSPFPFVDFHADFHTTVDRKSINFSGVVGSYNVALYRCCVEFYFTLLAGQLPADRPCKLYLRYINTAAPSKGMFFHPSLLLINGSNMLFQSVQCILRIDNYAYHEASLLLAGLGKTYFEQPRSASVHTEYLDACAAFITYFARADRQEYRWVDLFKKRFAEMLKSQSAAIIPGSSLRKDAELFYRKKVDAQLTLPEYLGVSITDFNISDKVFKETLGIKDFANSDEVLKYFKQCTFTGNCSDKDISEQEQRELLANVYQLFEMKGSNKDYLSTHRFPQAATRIGRDSNSTPNQANYHVSTLFLKTLDGKYRPAQLCRITDIDVNFLPDVSKTPRRDTFLRFLGVSFDKDFVFADLRLFVKLGNGTDYLPQPIRRNTNKEVISGELISNFYLIGNGRRMHPALINNNEYRFFHNVSRLSLREELDNLYVKRYESFPPEYKLHLLNVLKKNLSWKSDMLRLYQRIFKIFDNDAEYLVQENGQLSWVKHREFAVVSGRNDFELYSRIPDSPLLCFYSVPYLSDTLRKKIVYSQKGKISIEAETEHHELKTLLSEKILYLLLSISQSRNSEVNYLDDERDLTNLQDRLDRLVIKEGSNLTQDVHFGAHKVVSGKRFAFDESVDRSILYFEKGSSNREKATGISDFMFDNLSISETLELILFHKEMEDLSSEFDPVDVAMLSKKWKKDFSVKFIRFQRELLERFGQFPCSDDKWNIYNRHHKSRVLRDLDAQGRLEEFAEFLLWLKNVEEYQGYFDGFDLEIDKSDILNRVAALRLLSEQTQLPKTVTTQIDVLQPILGIEEELSRIEALLDQEQVVAKASELREKVEELASTSTVARISGALSDFDKPVTSTVLTGGAVQNVAPKKKALIFTGSNVGGDGGHLEVIGATGEEQVLTYFLRQLLALDIKRRKTAVSDIFELLKGKVHLARLTGYRNECLKNIEGNMEFAKSLIPLLYVTLHAKYAYFDLVGYADGKPMLVEVKTTFSDRNNPFYLSAAEIDAARGEDPYEIVRVSPSSINFLGNPIKLIEKKLATISGDNFTITPRNYEFRLH